MNRAMMSEHAGLTSTARFMRALTLCLVAAGAGAGGQALAQGAMQGVPNAMQGFSQNRDQPIHIDAASLEVRDKDKAATFSGNVKVVQGDTTMRSKTLVVFYDNDQPAAGGKKPAMKSSTPGPGGSSSIKRLEAKGGVVVTQKEQTVTGDRGVFDMRANTVTMYGNVLLTKDKNVLRGDRLIVDLTTGISRVESDSGRVSGVFQSSPAKSPGGGGNPAAPSPNAPGKPLKLNALPSSKPPRG
jgi:lipopolysaccharide export system protein LptA